MRRGGRSVGLALLGSAVLAGGLAVGCRSTGSSTPLTEDELAMARTALDTPMPSSTAALYHLRVPSSGGMKLSLVRLEAAGRLTISEPFGSTVAVADWNSRGETRLYDLKQACQIEGGRLSEVLGVAAMPVPAVSRLLGGRFPVTAGDRVRFGSDGRIEILGSQWTGFVSVLPSPWRVVKVEGPPGDGSWTLWLKDHSGSVPGWIRVEGSDGRWAELELVRLEHSTVTSLPPLPTLPVCGDEED